MLILDTKLFQHSSPVARLCLLLSLELSVEQSNIAMDIVYVHGLRLETIIGIWEWERQVKQTVLVDLDLGTDIAKSASSDAIEDTVDYKAVANRLGKLANESEFLLVEALAETISAILISEFGVEWLRVRINKQGALKGVRDVGVIIERRRT